MVDNATQNGVKVLYGDSTRSVLSPNVLDQLLALVLCARDVGTAFGELATLQRQCDAVSDNVAALVTDLDAFLAQAEIGLRATALGCRRPEIVQHGEEAVIALQRQVAGWRQRYLDRLEAQNTRAASRTKVLTAAMAEALERFLLAHCDASPQRLLRRKLDATRYDDSAILEPFPGIRLELRLQDSEPEAPRKLRTLLGKGARLQIGTKRGRLRRSEEPAYVGLDDLVLIEAEIGVERMRLSLAKKPGDKIVQVEVVKAEDGMRGAGARTDGVQATLPLTDRPVMTAIWEAMQAEARRIYAGPRALQMLRIDSKPAADAEALMQIAQRLVHLHRAIVADLVKHSANPDELTIKLETPDGKREESWVRRDELAQHLLGLPPAVLSRVGIPELFRDGGLTAGHAAPRLTAIEHVDAGEDSGQIDLGALAAEVSASLSDDAIEDISVHDIIIESDVSGLDDDDCAGPTRIRSRG